MSTRIQVGGVPRALERLVAGMRQRADALVTYRCLRAKRRAMLEQERAEARTRVAREADRKEAADYWQQRADTAKFKEQRLEALIGEPIDPKAWDKCTLQHCFASWALAGVIKWTLLVVGTLGVFAGHSDIGVAGWAFAGLFQVLQISSSADLARGLSKLRQSQSQGFASLESGCAAADRANRMARKAHWNVVLHRLTVAVTGGVHLRRKGMD